VGPATTGSLPRTGAGGPPLDAILLATSAVGVGAVLVLLTRRRRIA
jgi:hypothetical protein